MEIRLKPELENFLREKIESGQYKSIDEAINKSLELLKSQDEIYQGRFYELKREIMIGSEAAERGEVINVEIVFQQLKQKLSTWTKYKLTVRSGKRQEATGETSYAIRVPRHK